MEETDYLQREKEYTIQHFGFDPSILVQEITEESLEYLTSSLGNAFIKKENSRL